MLNTATVTEKQATETETCKASVAIPKSLVDRAREGDVEAMKLIFRPFIPDDEKIIWIGYLGKLGLLFGRHSLACLTDKRIADITLGWFGEVLYQDALLEYFNSSILLQPSRLLLYLLCLLVPTGIVSIYISFWPPMQLSFSGWELLPIALVGLISALLIAEFVIRLYYALSKCGIILWIKDGVSIYMFCDRSKTLRVNSLLRMIRIVRDQRVANLGHLG